MSELWPVGLLFYYYYFSEKIRLAGQNFTWNVKLNFLPNVKKKKKRKNSIKISSAAIVISTLRVLRCKDSTEIFLSVRFL